jgi:hypothetical protein
MSRPLVLTTQSGLTTSLSWWAHMRVEGDSVVLASSSDDGWPDSSLVIAELSSDSEAKALFRTLNERILLKARTFDARDWPAPIRSQTSDDSAEEGR